MDGFQPQSAATGDAPVDAAAQASATAPGAGDATGSDSADLASLVAALTGGAGEPPEGAPAPDGVSSDVDPFAAEDVDDDESVDASDEDDEDDEDDEESDVEALQRELAELRQAKRDAEAAAAEANAQRHWSGKFQQADQRLQAGIAYFLSNLETAYDKEAFAREYLPRMIGGYANDLVAIKDEQIRSVWQIARQHGSQGFVQQLAQHYRLTPADVERVRAFPPEQMEAAARLIVEARGPVAQALTTTNDKLTKAQRQIGKQKLQQVTPPGSGRGVVTDLSKVRQSIKGTEEELPHLLSLIAGSR